MRIQDNWFSIGLIIVVSISLVLITWAVFNIQGISSEPKGPTIEYEGIHNGWYVYKITSMGDVPKESTLFNARIALGSKECPASIAKLGYLNHSYTNTEWQYYGNMTYNDVNNDNYFSVGDEINFKSTQIGGPAQRGVPVFIVANGRSFATNIPE